MMIPDLQPLARYETLLHFRLHPRRRGDL